MDLKRRQIVWANLDGIGGEIKGKNIPCVILQNNKGNAVSNTTIVVPIIAKSNYIKSHSSAYVHIRKDDFYNLDIEASIAVCDQIRVIDKKRITKTVKALLSEERTKQIEDYFLNKIGYGKPNKLYKLVWVIYNDGVGNEQNSEKAFPALVIGRDNEKKQTLLIAPLSKVKKGYTLPTQVKIPSGCISSEFEEKILSFEQMRVIDKTRIVSHFTQDNIEFSDTLSLEIARAFVNNLSLQLYRRGQIVWADLEGIGSEQRGLRPCVIVQNDTGNKLSPTTIVLPLTSSAPKVDLAVNINVKQEEFVGASYNYRSSIVLCNQIQAIDSSRIKQVDNCIFSTDVMERINEGLLTSVGYNDDNRVELVYYTSSDGIGREQRSMEPIPAVCIQNSYGNKYSSILIVAPLISSKRNKPLPTQVKIDNFNDNGELKVAALEQVRVIDKRRVVENVDVLTKDKSKEVLDAYCVSLGINPK
ncbi:type II toxin-antitoxin system PemK/MazF family toxin [Priestia megaterium]|uniref:type II toxin-antitoxin system PemK/MazF family toxin n=1 Tax=Priestia megaterium TaxID=1404 RepID=UPI002E224AF8|nr:type II toxin-antitoxin system PemK/MazF family toxin [Priestia megaterium]